LESEERTYLASDYATGSTSLTVRDNNGFEATNFVVVGEPRQEQTEAKNVTALSGNTGITISATLKFSHTKSCPIYQSLFDKIDVVRATSSAGAYSAISGSPFNIDWDNASGKTLVTDSSGTSGHYYKYRFYNSITGAYSDYSGVISGGGLERDSAGFVLTQIYNNPIAKGVPANVLFEFMTDYQDFIYEKMPKAWWFTREGTAAATVADSYKFNISTNWSDLASLKFVLYRYISGSTDNTYPLKERTDLEMYNLKSDSNQSNNDNASLWALLPPDSSSAKGYIAIHPTPSTTNCRVIPVYEIELSTISSFSDTLVIPHVRGYKDYCLFRIFDDIKGDAGNAAKYAAKVEASVFGLKQRAKRKQSSEVFKRYRGVRGYERMFGSGYSLSNDDRKERYW